MASIEIDIEDFYVETGKNEKIALAKMLAEDGYCAVANPGSRRIPSVFLSADNLSDINKLLFIREIFDKYSESELRQLLSK